MLRKIREELMVMAKGSGGSKSSMRADPAASNGKEATQDHLVTV